MKNSKYFYIIMLVICTVICLLLYNNQYKKDDLYNLGDTSSSYSVSIYINKTKVTLTKGKSITLNTRIMSNRKNVTGNNVTWKSSNKKIASVDENGKVTAKAVGEATITAKSVTYGVSAECRVIVKDDANKKTNPIKVTTNQIISVEYSNKDSNVNFTGATNSQGTVTYSIVSQKNNKGAGVKVFSIPSKNKSNVKVAAKTSAGIYTVVVRAKAKGNNNYKSGSKDITLKIIVKKTTTPTKKTNPISVIAKQSFKTLYSDAIQYIKFAKATNVYGKLTYSIISQKNSLGGVINYFSIPTTNESTLKMAAKTNPGTYSIVIRAKADGNSTYSAGYKDITIVLSVNATTKDSKSNAMLFAPCCENGKNTITSDYACNQCQNCTAGACPTSEQNQTSEPDNSELNKSNITLAVGEKDTISVTSIPSKTNSLIWSSDNPSVATVDESGKVIAIGKGNAVITMTNSNTNKKLTCNVTVVNEKKYAEVSFINVYNTKEILDSLKDSDTHKHGYDFGEVVIIKSLDNKYILIDTGFDNEKIAESIYNRLKEYQINDQVVIDYFILTHAHADHAGNVMKLLNNSNITIKKIIMKDDMNGRVNIIKYSKVASKFSDGVMIKTNDKEEGYKISAGDYFDIYLFNNKDVFDGMNCNVDKQYVSYTRDIKNATAINGKYYYFDGLEYDGLKEMKLKSTTKAKTKYSSTKKGMDNYFYVKVLGSRTDCNANSNSLAILIKVKTQKGNRYMYFPGDIDNGGYDIVSDSYGYYGNGEEIIFDNVSVSNGKLKGQTTGYNKTLSETNAANSIANMLGKELDKITIYQAAHHGKNNAPDAMKKLKLNRKDVNTIFTWRVGPESYTGFSMTRTYYYTLNNTKRYIVGGKDKHGIYCSINDKANTVCKNY